MYIWVMYQLSLVPLYMIISTYIMVITCQHILWWPRDAVRGLLVTGVN